jgi:Ca2+-binding RTX toxin-like protein
MPTLANITSINFDYDGVLAERNLGGATVFVELDRALEPGEELRLIVGFREFRVHAFERDGTFKHIYIDGGTHSVSADGTKIRFDLPNRMYFEQSTVAARVLTSDIVGETTTVNFTRADEADDHLNVGNRIANVEFTDQFGRETPLLNDNTTQLLLVDFAAAWCLPSRYIAEAEPELLKLLGSGVEYKTVLLQNRQIEWSDVADAAKWDYDYKLESDVLSFAGDRQAQSQFLKYNYIAKFSTLALIDQVTGEVLANFTVSEVDDAGSIAAAVALKIAEVTTAIEALAGTPGVTRSGGPLGDAIAGSVRDDLLDGGAGNDFINAGYGHDRVHGGDGVDLLNGDGGDDRLFGEGGIDQLRGGSGDDILIGGEGDDQLIGNAGFNRLNGGEGEDKASFGDATAGLRIALNGDSAAAIRIGGVVVGSIRSVEDIDGGDHADRLTGDAGSNTLNGGEGDDRLDGGGSPSDLGLIGHSDELNGEGGDDQIWVSSGYAMVNGGSGVNHMHLSSGATVLRSGGYDIVDFSAANAAVTMSRESRPYYQFAASESDVIGGNLFGVAEIRGTRFADQLVANEDVRVLDGGLGADRMYDGEGDTLFFVDNTGDRVIGRADGGIDLVESSVSFRLGADIEDLLLTGAAAINGVGNSLANYMDGNKARNHLSGLDGDDVLEGLAGDDVLTGGAGDDTLNGGGGLDMVRYTEAAAGVTVDLRLSGSQDTVGAGSDTLSSIEQVSGSSFDDTLHGSGSANILKGEAGADQLFGYSGTDRLTGGDGDDHLDGGRGDDQLHGDAGRDELTGGVGRDQLFGGAGADRFVYTAVAQSTVASSGRDIIKDFSRAEGDRIDLGAIDAVAGGADDPFTWVAAFSGQAGQLSYRQLGDYGLAQVDLDGDRIADFSISVVGTTALQAGDFVL